MAEARDIRLALAQAMARAGVKCNRLETGMYRYDPASKADKAIQKLRTDRRLTLEELHKPMTI